MSHDFLSPPTKIYENVYTGPVVNQANALAVQIFSVLSIVLAMVPLISFVRIQQVGPCSLIFVSTLFSGLAVINSYVWDNEDHAHWYGGAGICHIEALLRQPLTVAFSLAMVLMPWKLIKTLTTRNICQKNHVWRDILFVWGIPLFFILPFQYFVMSNVYSIFPGFGCVPEFNDSWLSLIIVYIWWVLLLPVTFILSGIMCLMIHRKREEIRNSLNDKSSRVIQRPFIKLYVMVIIIIAIYIPVQFTFIIQYVPWHFENRNSPALENLNTWNVPTFYHTNDNSKIQYQPWAYISTNLLIFLFYGASDEAQKLYWKLLQKLGFGRIFPKFNGPRPSRNSEDYAGLLSYADLVEFIIKRLERRRGQDELEKGFESSSAEGYRIQCMRDDTSTNTTITTASSTCKVLRSSENDLLEKDVDLEKIKTSSLTRQLFSRLGL